MALVPAVPSIGVAKCAGAAAVLWVAGAARQRLACPGAAAPAAWWLQQQLYLTVSGCASCRSFVRTDPAWLVG